MRIADLLTNGTVVLDVAATSKTEVLNELIEQLDKEGCLNAKEEFTKGILKREEQSTTGIGEGIAIPHAKSKAVKTSSIAFGRSKSGINFESLDEQSAHLFFMIAASEGADNEHLEALARLSTILMDTQLREKLLQATSEEEVIAVINEKENELDESAGDKSEKEEVIEPSEPTVLAVTACPTGIAHTYMAAEKLTETANENGLSIKVETNGSSGVKNRLTTKEITEADAIIVAADTKVEMARFDGKHVIQVPVAKAMNESEQLLNQAIKQEAPLYHYEGSRQSTDDDQKKQNAFYKHLMNGVSNMLPFVVGGGILIAISFFWGVDSANPDSADYNAFAAMLNEIGSGQAFFLMVPVLAGFIASSIADRPGFAPGMVGGLIAVTVTGAVGADGGSGFLGGLIAGFLAGYVTLFIKKILEKLPDSLEGLKPVLF